jgi:uncharacterized protein Smg (DUF494 family)
MKEKVVELLIFIMSEIQDNKRLSDIDLGALRERGYTQSEISAAFSWIYDNVQSVNLRGGSPGTAGNGSRRVLHEIEKMAFSTESQGYLIQLSELGLLDEKDMETVIERVMAGGYEKLSVEEVREIVASVLFTAEKVNRYMLNSGDTIH